MKIKAVCEKTGLSDKTIRYYIRSGLIFPKYNENYTGRKNFDFSEKDIERLNQVVILRKYNFTIKSIKALFDQSENMNTIVQEHINTMRAETENSAQLIARLNEISSCKFKNIADLCNMLNKNECIPENVPSADNTKPYKLLYTKNKKHNKILIVLIALIIIISMSLYAEIYNNIKCITGSSVVNINNGFVGLRLIETDDIHDSIQYVNDLYIDDNSNTVSDKFDEYSTSVKKSFLGRDTIVIHAVVHTDKDFVKIVPTYESKYSGELIYCNSSSWLGLNEEDQVTVKSLSAMKSKTYKYEYEIEIIHS